MNREALKQLACLTIDTQAAQRTGNKIFMGSGTSEELMDLAAIFKDILATANAIVEHINDIKKD